MIKMVIMIEGLYNFFYAIVTHVINRPIPPYKFVWSFCTNMVSRLCHFKALYYRL